MSKKKTWRILSGFLAFLMIFFSVSDYAVPVLAANGNGEEALISEVDDERESSDMVEAETTKVELEDVETEDSVSSNTTDDQQNADVEDVEDVVIEDEDVIPSQATADLKFVNEGDGKWTATYGTATNVTIAKYNATTKTITFEADTRINEIPALFAGATGVLATIKTDVKTVVLPTTNNRIVDIANNAFDGCTNLQSINIKDCKYNAQSGATEGLTRIGKGAFHGCSALKSIDLGETVVEIGVEAFSNSGLESITLVPTIKAIKTDAFKSCTSLTTVVDNITVLNESNINSFSVFGGCSIKTITFADDVKVVPNSLFWGADYADDAVITIPKQIEVIDKFAFGSSKTLKKIKFEAGSKLTTINIQAFEGCYSLISDDTSPLVFPASLTKIDKNGFKGCTALKKIDFSNANVNYLGESAFESCTGLTSLKLSSKIATMDKAAFKNCIGLTSIEIPMEKLGKNAFEGCSGLTSVTFKDNVHEIGDYAFKDCTAIPTITLPVFIEKIGSYAFQGCAALTNVKVTKQIGGSYYEGFTYIGNYAFQNCGELRRFNSEVDGTIDIPNCVTEIGMQAFYLGDWPTEAKIKANSDLIKNNPTQRIKVINLPDSLQKIGDQAFWNNKLVSKIVIPKNVNSIGKQAFAIKEPNGYQEEGGNLETVQIDSVNLKTNGMGAGIFQYGKIKNLIFGSGITEIPDYMFNAATFVSGAKIEIPSTVTKIGKHAFQSIEVETIDIKSDSEGKYHLESIGDYAFANNASLESLYLPDSLKEIGTEAFRDCSHLSNVVIPENVKKLGSKIWYGCTNLGDVYYNVISFDTCGTDLFFSAKLYNAYLGPKVTKIPAGLFAGATFVKQDNTTVNNDVTLVIPASMKEFPNQALINIKNLGTVIFASDEDITKIGSEAFKSCENLKNVIVNTTAVYNEELGGYTRDESKDVPGLPSSVTEIGAQAFSECTSLENVKLPKACTSLGNSIFANATSLKTISIPADVEYLGSEAFSGCTALQEVKFEGNKIQNILNSTFEGCASLTGLLDIQPGIVKIGSKAYKDCIGITEVDFPTTVESIANDAFEGCNITKFYALKDSPAYKWLVLNGFATQVADKFAIKYENLEADDVNRNDGSYRPGEELVFVDAEREGFTFLGWYTDQALTNKVTSTKGMTGDITLYASWKATEYTVTYDLDDGQNNTKNPATVLHRSDLVLYTPIKPGCEFVNWVQVIETINEETGEVIKETEKNITAKTDEAGEKIWVIPAVKENVKVRAKWKAYNYSITYDLNGGKARTKYQNDLKSVSVTGDKEVTLPHSNVACKLNKKGKEAFVLIGWNTAKDGTGTTYDCGATVKNIATQNNQKITLYAMWADDYFFIKYVANGKGASISDNMITKVPFSMSHKKALYTENNVSRPGFVFNGWATKANGKGKQFTAGQIIDGANDFGAKKLKKTITLYAKWTPITYTIEYNYGANEGATLTSKAKTVFTAKKTYTLKKPKKAGYKFMGWYDNPEFTGNKIKSTKKVYKNLVLYAKWMPK